MVEEVYNNATESLNEDDKTLPQVVHILPLLKRGIGNRVLLFYLPIRNSP